jgi:hypothetical protein
MRERLIWFSGIDFLLGLVIKHVHTLINLNYNIEVGGEATFQNLLISDSIPNEKR